MFSYQDQIFDKELCTGLDLTAYNPRALQFIAHLPFASYLAKLTRVTARTSNTTCRSLPVPSLTGLSHLLQAQDSCSLVMVSCHHCSVPFALYERGFKKILDQGVMSGLLTGSAFTTQFPAIDTTDGGGGSSSLQGLVVAIYEIGCFVGAIIAFAFGERLGRRWTIIVGCLILIIGAAVQTAATEISHLIAGRIVAGFGNGMNTATIRKLKVRSVES